MISTPPFPPFTEETALEKVQWVENTWNTRDPELVCLSCTVDAIWRDSDKLLIGREAIKQSLYQKWKRELDYRLKKELWDYRSNRIIVRLEYEWRVNSGQWFHSSGMDHWEFDCKGLMQKRYTTHIYHSPIKPNDRKLM